MGTPLTGKGPNSPKVSGVVPGSGGRKMTGGGKATPLTGKSQNSPVNYTKGPLVVLNGRAVPSVKKTNIPTLGRDSIGRVNLGF